MPRRIPANGPENLEGRKTGMEMDRPVPVCALTCCPDSPAVLEATKWHCTRDIAGDIHGMSGANRPGDPTVWLNRRARVPPTCRRLAPDFALFPPATGWPAVRLSGPTKNREVGRPVRVSLSRRHVGGTGGPADGPNRLAHDFPAARYRRAPDPPEKKAPPRTAAQNGARPRRAAWYHGRARIPKSAAITPPARSHAPASGRRPGAHSPRGRPAGPEWRLVWEP